MDRGCTKTVVVVVDGVAVATPKIDVVVAVTRVVGKV